VFVTLYKALLFLLFHKHLYMVCKSKSQSYHSYQYKLNINKLAYNQISNNAIC